jgi:hypothetical protein
MFQPKTRKEGLSAINIPMKLEMRCAPSINYSTNILIFKKIDGKGTLFWFASGNGVSGLGIHFRITTQLPASNCVS